MALLTGGGRGQKRPPDGGLFDLSGERLTGWRSREQLKTHLQKNAADYGKVCRKSSNGSISKFNVFFCFNIILTLTMLFFVVFFNCSAFKYAQSADVFHVFRRKYLHFHIRKLFHRRVKSALIAHGESVFGRKGVRTQRCSDAKVFGRKGVRTQKAGTSLFANCVVYYDFMRQDTQRRRDT